MLKPVDIIKLIFDDKRRKITIYPDGILNELEERLFCMGTDEVMIRLDNESTKTHTNILYKREENFAYLIGKIPVRELRYKRKS